MDNDKLKIAELEKRIAKLELQLHQITVQLSPLKGKKITLPRGNRGI